jgi:hypothetical protein
MRGAVGRWTVTLVVTLGSITALPCLAPPAEGQPSDAGMPRSAILTREIQILETLRGMGFTADQRRQAAALIEQFVQERQKADKARDPDALVQALLAVRAALIKGEPPTPQMRQAVEAARPPDVGALEQSVQAARNTALDGLSKLLTTDQKAQLEMMPLVGFATQAVDWSIGAHDMPPDQWQQARLQVFPDVRDRIRRYAGTTADATLANLQRTVDRLHDMPVDQIQQQRDQLVAGLVTVLRDALLSDAAGADAQLRDQLWEWLEDPHVLGVLKESAAAMGAA